MSDKCAQCHKPIIASDDDAFVCIECGGRNRRGPADTGSPDFEKLREIAGNMVLKGFSRHDAGEVNYAANHILSLESRLKEAEERAKANQEDAENFRYLEGIIEWKPKAYDGCSYGRFDLMWPNEEPDLRKAIEARRR